MVEKIEKITKDPSSWNRLNDRFNKIEGDGLYRSVLLGDNTNIILKKVKGHFFDLESCHVIVKLPEYESADTEDKGNYEFSFAINRQGLRWTDSSELRSVLKSIDINDIFVENIGEKERYRRPRAYLGHYLESDKIAIAEVLVDWLDQVIGEDKYSALPVSNPIFK